jgi:Ala-tRNA(Pro) deacylase
VTGRVERWLRDSGVAFHLMEHAPASTSEEAARARGTPLESGAKALVLLADSGPAHVVLPASRRLDNGRLRAILGTRTLRFATPDELLTLTGCTPGALPPFARLFGLPALVDEELTQRESIVFSAGSNTVSIRMRGDDFFRLSEAAVHALSRG